MDREVFLSLLALDSYNRGYKANLDDLPQSGQMGTATIREVEPGEQEGWEDAGFYASAYEWNGETIISYRGTNFDFDDTSLEAFLESPALRDAWNGWRIGAGFDTASQAGLAEDFYKAVVYGDLASSSSVFTPNEAPVTLTGHSLGGVLPAISLR